MDILSMKKEAKLLASELAEVKKGKGHADLRRNSLDMILSLKHLFIE